MLGLLTDDPLDTDQFDDRNIIARTLWGEARGEGEYGMQAVANVIKNRLSSGVRWWGHSLRTVCLARYQFSCWNAKDPNRPKLMAVTEDDPQFRIAIRLADQTLAGSLPDIVNGADSYVDSRMPDKPNWCRCRDPACIQGHHWFYRTI